MSAHVDFHAFPYVRAVRDTASVGLAHFARLETEAKRWLANEHRESPKQVAGRIPPHSANEYVLERIEREHGVVDAFEGFLSAWARTSLLLFPKPRRDAPLKAVTRERGKRLVQLLGLDEAHPLNLRSVRDAWMHTDERLDDAVQQGLEPDFEEFTTAAEAEDYVETTMWVVEVDTLRVRYREAGGAKAIAALREMRDVLHGVHESARREIDAQRRARFPAGA